MIPHVHDVANQQCLCDVIFVKIIYSPVVRSFNIKIIRLELD